MARPRVAGRGAIFFARGPSESPEGMGRHVLEGAMASHRYAALLRGVSPMNAKMSELKAAFEAAGFADVKTVLSSGNLLFSAPAQSSAKLVQRAEAAMKAHLGKTFATFVEPVEALRALIEADPWNGWNVPPAAKRVVTFLREDHGPSVALPLSRDGVSIYARQGRRVFTAYVANERGPVFMAMLQKTFGDDITTRTWDTVRKLAGDPRAL